MNEPNNAGLDAELKAATAIIKDPEKLREIMTPDFSVPSFKIGGSQPDNVVNQIEQILNWHKDACPNPTASDIYTATACCYEEMAEYAKAVDNYGVADILLNVATNSYDTAKKLKEYDDRDEFVQVALSSLGHVDKKAHLDALCDIIVVALQDGYRSGYDMVGALNEVIRSNESKRLPDGTFPRNEAGKIIKTSPLYFEADVTPYLGNQ